MVDDPRYWAFISYSHRDKRWGDWLHRALESYAVPRRMVGTPGRDGPLPKRLLPVFRDREELPGSADLASDLQSALRASRTLIVICSPSAATSRWVDQEVLEFKRLGREARILSLIVDGEPNASDRPGSGAAECFPPSLRYRLGPDGELSSVRAEPIAADLRPGMDGRGDALLKLIAGVLGVPYDSLRQRELRRRRQRLIASLSVGIVFLCAGALAWRHQQTVELRTDRFERGVEAVLNEDRDVAALWLLEAYKLGAQDSELRAELGAVQDLRYWLGQAMQSVDARRGVLRSGCGTIHDWDVSLDGARIALVCADGRVEVRSLEDARLEAGFATGPAHVAGTGVAFLPGGHGLITSDRGDKGGIAVWDLGSGAVRLHIPTTGYAEARATPDGTLLLVMTNRSTQVWDLRAGTLQRELGFAAFRRDHRPRGEIPINAEGAGCFRSGDAAVLQRVTDGVIVARVADRGAGYCEFDAAGARGAWVARDESTEENEVLLFDARSGGKRSQLALGTQEPTGLRFGGGTDDALVVLATDDGRVSLRRGDTGTTIATIDAGVRGFPQLLALPGGLLAIHEARQGAAVTVMSPLDGSVVRRFRIPRSMAFVDRRPRHPELLVVEGDQVYAVVLSGIFRPPLDATQLAWLRGGCTFDATTASGRSGAQADADDGCGPQDQDIRERLERMGNAAELLADAGLVAVTDASHARETRSPEEVEQRIACALSLRLGEDGPMPTVPPPGCLPGR